MVPKSHQMEDLSECMVMKDTFRLSVMSLIANSTSCINDKIEEAESYVMDIYVRSWKTVEEINALKDKGMECTKHIDGIKQLSGAIACVTKATAKASYLIAKLVPAVSLDITKLVTEISTLQLSLTFCMSTNTLWTIAEEAKPVAVSIKNCIKEKLKKPEA